MSGTLPAALYVAHGDGRSRPDSFGLRVPGFFVQVRAAIAEPGLSDGDLYSLKMRTDAGERVLIERQAVYRDWVPERAPALSCKDASLPGIWDLPPPPNAFWHSDFFW